MKFKTLIVTGLATLGMVGIFGHRTQAVHASNVTNTPASFTIKPELPSDNAEGVNYFQFKVTPGQKRVLTIDVTNNSKTTKQYDITPAIVSTNSNGIMDYSIANKSAKLPAQLAQILSPSKTQVLTIKANSTVKVPYRFTAPAKSFSGLMLAGFTVGEHDADKSSTVAKNANGMSGAKANIHYLIALEFYNSLSDMSGKPNVTIGDASYDLSHKKPMVMLNVENASNVIVPAVTTKAKLVDANNKTVFTINKKMMQFAPQNAFKFKFDLNNKKLPAGKYRLVGTIKSTTNGSEYKWSFDKPFTVTQAKAADVKAHAANFTPKAQIPWYMYALAIGGGLIIVLAIGKFVYDVIKKRKTETESSDK